MYKFVFMIHVGLTGNRYSGKDSVSKVFKKIGVPVFEADVILRFAIHYNVLLLKKLKIELPEYFNDGTINMSKIKRDGRFGEVVKFFEDELFEAYRKFNIKNTNSVYTIFHSSVLFESDFSKKMDMNISIFSPIDERVRRCRSLTGMNIFDIHKLTKLEINDLEKNNLSTYVIHNYNIPGNNVKKNVLEVDKKIIDCYLYKRLDSNLNER